MPADITARYYTWYMTNDPFAQIVAFQWWPDGEFVSSMTLGKLIFVNRDQPGDVWGPPRTAAETIPWIVAQNIARGQGFAVEVAEK